MQRAAARAWAAVAGAGDVPPASVDGLAAARAAAAVEGGRRRGAEVAAALLTEVGGLEIAAMAGAIMTAAQVWLTPVQSCCCSCFRAGFEIGGAGLLCIEGACQVAALGFSQTRDVHAFSDEEEVF